MKPEFRPAIEALRGELLDFEKKVAETKAMINRLCVLAESEPLYPDLRTPDKPSLTTTRSDQFYGKKQHSAAREYLEMRHAANLGPATPREIYSALVEGGFGFETSNETHAITGLRTTLRKNSSIFHRLPNGQYGLLSWYPNAKAAKSDTENDERPKSNRGRRQIVHRAVAKRAQRTHLDAKPVVTPFIMEAMSDGSDWTTEKLKAKALSDDLPGIETTTQRNVFHGALLNLLRKGIVAQTGKGAWRLTDPSPSSSAQIVPIKGAAA
jgi:hypothetical protein